MSELSLDQRVRPAQQPAVGAPGLTPAPDGRFQTFLLNFLTTLPEKEFIISQDSLKFWLRRDAKERLDRGRRD